MVEARVPEETLTFRGIWSFFWPLAMSDVMMSVIHPVMMAGLARDANGTYNLTVYGAAFSIIVLLESPIIMILHTANALVKSQGRFGRVRDYMLLLSVLSLALLLVLGFTDAGLTILQDMMGLPADVARDTAGFLQMFLVWPLLIGWRRLCQGTLIRLGKTSVVGVGTVSRLVLAVTMMVLHLAWTGSLGLYTAGLILILSMAIETLIVTLFTVAALSSGRLPIVPNDSLRMRDVHAFYVPLFLTTLVMVITRPILIAGLARLPHPEEMIASWSVIYSITILFSNHGRGFINVVITLADSQRNLAVIGRFGMVVGVVSSALLVVLGITPLGSWFLVVAMGIEDQILGQVQAGLLLTSLVPFLRVLQNRARGVLIRINATYQLNLISLVNVSVMILGAFLISSLQLPGVAAASTVFLLAYICEVFVLQTAVQRKAIDSLLIEQKGTSS